VDWRAQDYYTTSGVSEVRWDEERSCLVASCKLEGKHTNLSSGEIVLDLKYVAGLEGNVPVDFTQRTIVVVVYVPRAFVGWNSAPNGLRGMVKDSASRSQYGSWSNCQTPGYYTLTLRPSALGIADGHTDAAFDPKSIETIGVSFAMGGESKHRFEGEIYVTDVSISPALPIVAPPDLPMAAAATTPLDGAVTVKADGFYLDRTRLGFILGGNDHLIEYGQNFGISDWFPRGNGVSRHKGYIDARFALYRRAGVQVVRCGLVDDGRAVLDKNGKVVGLNEVFWNDVQCLLETADKHKIKIEFTLVDFLIAGPARIIDGVQVQGRRQVIEDPEIRGQFVRDFVEPFVQRFGRHNATWGFDVVNEGEWLVKEDEGGGWEDVKNLETKATQPISRTAFEAFCTECIQVVRRRTLRARGHEVAARIS